MPKQKPLETYEYRRWRKGVTSLREYLTEFRKQVKFHRSALVKMTNAVIKVNTRTRRIDPSCVSDVVKAAYGLAMAFPRYVNEARRVTESSLQELAGFYASAPRVTNEERLKIIDDLKTLQKSVANANLLAVRTVKYEIKVLDDLTENYAPDLHEVFCKREIVETAKKLDRSEQRDKVLHPIRALGI